MYDTKHGHINKKINKTRYKVVSDLKHNAKNKVE